MIWGLKLLFLFLILLRIPLPTRDLPPQPPPPTTTPLTAPLLSLGVVHRRLPVRRGRLPHLHLPGLLRHGVADHDLLGGSGEGPAVGADREEGGVRVRGVGGVRRLDDAGELRQGRERRGVEKGGFKDSVRTVSQGVSQRFVAFRSSADLGPFLTSMTRTENSDSLRSTLLSLSTAQQTKHVSIVSRMMPAMYWKKSMDMTPTKVAATGATQCSCPQYPSSSDAYLVMSMSSTIMMNTASTGYQRLKRT